MVFSDTMFIDMDAFDMNEVTNYLKTDYPQILYIRYRKDVKYLDLVSSQKITNMYELYQKLVQYQANTTQVQLQKAWQDMRIERNRRLRETDWTQLEDAKKALSPEVASIWLIYRQYLRNLPANTMDPYNPIWPTMPQ
jgi:hypothetical protein